MGVADRLATPHPDVAVSLYGGHSGAHVARAVALLQRDEADAVGALAAARLALAADPLAPGAASVMAQALEAAGRGAEADAMWRAAARADLRDTVAQAHALEDALARGDAASVVAGLDIILRGSPGASASIGVALFPTLLTEKYRATLARALASGPPWRGRALAQMAAGAPNLDDLLALLGELQGGPEPTTDEEARPVLQRMMREGRYEEAYALWLGRLAPDRRPGGELLYNARFQYSVTGMPFDWSFDEARGASIRLGRLGARRILNVDFFGSRVPFRNVYQWLLLPPGQYVFSGLERAQGLANERGLRWRIHCAEDPGGELASTPLISGTLPWREFSVSFEVTPECRAQVLRLELPARTALEAVVSGNVAYMGLSIGQGLDRPANLDDIRKGN